MRERKGYRARVCRNARQDGIAKEKAGMQEKSFLEYDLDHSAFESLILVASKMSAVNHSLY